MFSCVALSIVFVLRTLDISFVEAMQQGAEQGFTRVFFLDDINNDRHFLKLFLSSILLIVATTGLDQDLMQRVLSSDSLRSAQRNMVMSSLFQSMLLITLLVLGVVLHLYMGENDILGVKPDEVFAHVASREGMPVIMSVLLVLGVVSATFSAIGGSLNALATSFTIDIMHARQRFEESRFTKIYRTALLSVAVLMVALVVVFDSWCSGSSINTFFAMSSYTFGPLLGMFVFGVISKRKVRDKWVPVVAIVSPLICGLLDCYSERLFDGYQFGFEIMLLNAVFTMLGLLILSHPLRK
jgi:Na+/proline symporter